MQVCGKERKVRMKTVIKEVSLIRAKVKHYSFVTGLVGALTGKSGGFEDSSCDLNVILRVTPHFREHSPNLCFLAGGLFECTDFLTFVCGTYDAKMLTEMKSPEGFNKPTEFTIETWEQVGDNDHKWQLT